MTETALISLIEIVDGKLYLIHNTLIVNDEETIEITDNDQKMRNLIFLLLN